ncbi:MAG: hypothetical protein Q9191_006051 [Dirinaria sp. TL-2023a]
MQFANILLVGASFLGAALAQSTIAFTTLPSAVQAGVPFTLKWAGGQDDNGPSTNLQYVATIAPSVKGNSFTWTPSSSLPNGEYALQISQGVDEVNYSGMFSLSGGSTAAASTTAASSASSSAAATSAASLLPIVVPSRNGTSSPSNSTSNSTVPTTTLLPGTGVVASGGSSAATGTALQRNTTLSKATLTGTKTTSTGPASTTAAATTAGGSTGSSTPKPTSAAIQVGSPIALILSVFAAVVYLG